DRSPTPFWVNLYYTLQGLGPWLLVALLVAMLFAFVPRPSELAVYIGVCTVLLLIFYCVVAGKALPHYYYAWVWAMIVLGAIGISNLWKLTSPFVRLWPRLLPKPRMLARELAIGILLVFFVNAAVTSFTIRQERPTGWALVQQVLKEHGQPNRWVLATGYPSWEWVPYLGGHVLAPVLTHAPGSTAEIWTLPKPTAPLDAIALATDGAAVNPTVQDFLRSHRSQFRRVNVNSVTLYIPTDHRQVILFGSTLSLVPDGTHHLRPVVRSV
ncbi:MAG: hypothetical protein JWP75_1643, partial [Frondihabitans sp.]|nr:hypothetical protein [Frondihabitans sp.]